MSIAPPAVGSIVDAIGGTPAVWLDRLAEGLPGRVLLKLESMNPGAMRSWMADSAPVWSSSS